MRLAHLVTRAHLWILAFPLLCCYTGHWMNSYVIAANGGVMPVYQKDCLSDPGAIGDADLVHKCATAMKAVHLKVLADWDSQDDGTASIGDALIDVGVATYHPSWFIWGTVVVLALTRPRTEPR